jgi:hypothetical protein
VIACGADKWLGVPSADDGGKEKKKAKDHLRNKANNKFGSGKKTKGSKGYSGG